METYEKTMEKHRVLIYGVRDNASIKERIALIYSEDRLATGDELYIAAKEAGQNQRLEKLESLEASRIFNETKDEIHEGVIKIRKAARYFYKNDPGTLKLLLADEAVPTNFAQWKQHSFDTLKAVEQNADIQAKFALVELTPEAIAAYLGKIEAVEQLRLDAEKEDGEAQQASQKKQETFDALHAYCVDLRECLDLFYSGPERQKLEEVGIIVK